MKEVLGPINEREFIAFYVHKLTKDPLATLIATILSQNTNEANAFKAWFNLLKRAGSVENICNLELQEIEEAIRPAGLYKSKARAILEACKRKEEVTKAILEGDRDYLLTIKGIGKKTADVVLLNFGHPTFPVDTHIFRIAKRLGLASGSYDKVSNKLSELFKGKELEAHMYLILFGRRICRSKNPLCEKCPFKETCTFRQEAGGPRQP
ncbi:DNA lyase [Ignicoccus pacificus DSM 13166]|uniref:DNA lyase n=1 Tax=Ignicoccus pacificus DSM 13166 TaxID=940294 RepID=A0A977K9I4_9CREN|nr:DNA lyase [Ignicoccus pacificus DSM 13166]